MKRNSLKDNNITILVTAWLIYFFMATPISYGTSVVSTRMVTEYGWNESIIGLSSSVYYAFVAVCCMLGGALEVKIGYKKTILIGAVTGTVGYGILCMGYTNPMIYMLMFGVLGGCSALSGLTSGPGLVNTWFGSKSILPMAILVSAGSIGGFLVPLLAQVLVERSIESCWLAYGGMCLVSVILAVLFVRDKKETEISVSGKTGNAADSKGREQVLVYCCSGKFISLVLQQFAIKAVTAGVFSYLVLYAVQNGISSIQAAMLLTIYSGMNFVGRIGTGAADRFPVTKKQLNELSMLICGSGCMLLAAAGNFPVFVIGAGLSGLGFGIGCTMRPILVAECFGSENFSVINGVFESICYVGNVAAPILIYKIAQLCGGYQYSFAAVGGYTLFCAFLAYRTEIGRIKTRQVSCVRQKFV